MHKEDVFHRITLSWKPISWTMLRVKCLVLNFSILQYLKFLPPPLVRQQNGCCIRDSHPIFFFQPPAEGEVSRGWRTSHSPPTTTMYYLQTCQLFFFPHLSIKFSAQYLHPVKLSFAVHAINLLQCKQVS